MVLLWNAIEPSILNLSQFAYAHPRCWLTAIGASLAGFIVFWSSLANAVSGCILVSMRWLFIFPSLQTLRQLFRIILDVINPSFAVEDRQWQPSAIIIFYNYFTALWQDPQVSYLLNHSLQISISSCRKRSRLPWIPGRKHCFLHISRPSQIVGMKPYSRHQCLNVWSSSTSSYNSILCFLVGEVCTMSVS